MGSSAPSERAEPFRVPGCTSRSSGSDVAIALADPHGAKMHAWVHPGELETDVDGGSVSQGIGQGRVTGNVDGAIVDHSFRIPDAEMVGVIDQLAATDGLLMGDRLASMWPAQSGLRNRWAPATRS